MSTPNKSELKALRAELDRIDKGQADECTMCKFVLIFAFVVLLLVLFFVFFFRLQPGVVIQGQTPTQMTTPLSASDIDQRIIDLKDVPPSSTDASAIQPLIPGAKNK